jgi:hypothetical protein
MAQLNVTELDFDNIRENLKTFLSSQSEFTDYNFDGSALSVLIDALAYNTHYNAILAHMVANESFLDSAIKRSSVVSIAKALGYTPRSMRAATATVDFTITAPGYSENIFTLSRDTMFVSSVNGSSYTFFPDQDVTVNKIGQVFSFPELRLREGTRVTNQFIIEAGKETDLISLPNKNIDTSTIRVRVAESRYTLNSTVTYNLNGGLLDIVATTPAWWLEETLDENYAIRFGDDVIGKKLTAGNVVIVDYLKTSGPDANGAKTFNCNPGSPLIINGETRLVVPGTVQAAAGGQRKESIDSIRVNAPKFTSTKNRAVTSNDYRSLILAANSNVQSVSVWGGELNDPPVYGKIFIALDPVAGQIITEQDKDNIRINIINPKGSIGMLTEFVDPEYTYIGLKVNAYYDPNKTIQTPGQITTAIKQAINTYFNTDLNKLGKSFYYSKVHNVVKDSLDSLVSLSISPILQKRVLITSYNTDASYSFSFNTRLHPRDLHSSWFNVYINGATIKAKLQDLPNASVVSPDYNGSGVVFLKSDLGATIGNVGTINYTTGEVKIQSMNVASLLGTEDSIRVNIKPNDDVKDILTSTLIRTSDISTAPVKAYPSKNTILALDDTSQNGTIGTRTGLSITVVPKVEDL